MDISLFNPSGRWEVHYKEILNAFKDDLPEERQWWPDYFYHFTDVHNAVSIIDIGWIYSRAKVLADNIMISDNASRIVIENTEADNKLFGRLYFRPLTPTQYHNEGFKPESVRHQDINASCPVPVFFLLSVERTMELDDVKFAERGVSGGRQNIREGVDEFRKLNLNKIYHHGFYDRQTDSDIREFRQSEVIREGGFPLSNLIRGVFCRSNAERETLLYLLKKQSSKQYEFYKKRIMYRPKLKMFFSNGIFIRELNIVDDELLVELNDTHFRLKQEVVEVPLKVEISINYLGEKGQPLGVSEVSREVNYCTVKQVDMKLKKIAGCISVLVKVMFDNTKMYENELLVIDDVIW